MSQTGSCRYIFYNGVEVVAAVVKRALSCEQDIRPSMSCIRWRILENSTKVVFAAELYRQDMKRFRVVDSQKVQKSTPDHAVSSQAGEKQRAGQPVSNPVQVGGMLAVKGTGGIRFLLQISIDREKVQIVFLGIRADIFFHKREDRVGGGNDWAGERRMCCTPRSAPGQSRCRPKQDRSPLRRSRVRSIAVDQTADPGA